MLIIAELSWLAERSQTQQTSAIDMTISATAAQYNCTFTKINIDYCHFKNKTAFFFFLPVVQEVFQITFESLVYVYKNKLEKTKGHFIKQNY